MRQNATDELLIRLGEFGLTAKEARIYLAALTYGPSPVLRIARQAGINRGSAYSIIASLQEKGLMATELKKLKTLYVAESPDNLERLLERKREALRLVLPELKTMHGLRGDHRIVTYRRGLRGIKTCYEDTLSDHRDGDYYWIISDTHLWLTLDRPYFGDFIIRRAKTYDQVRLLVKDTKVARDMRPQLEKYYRQSVKYLPATMQVSSVLLVLPRLVVIHTLYEPYEALVIRNTHVIQSFRQLYENFWMSLPR